MRSSRLFLAFAVCALSGAGAAAETATPDGARAIEQNYAAYLSRAVIDKGIVAVAPEGDSYVVTWDLQKAVDLAEPSPGALKIDPLTYRLTPGAGGSWALKGDYFPRVAFNVRTDKGQASGAFDFSGFHIDGLYDPQASEFLRSTLGVETLKGAFQMENGGQQSDFKITENGLTIEARAKPAADGAGIDLALAQAFKGMDESISAPPMGGGNEPVQMTYAMSGAVGGASFTGLRAREIGEFWKYVVAHLDKGATPPDLNAHIRSMLPLWNDINAHADISDFRFQMPDGEAQLKRLRESVRLTGLTGQGAAEIGVEVEGLSVKTELAPSWSGAFWPASFSLKLRASSEGWDKVAQIALDDPQFGEKSDLSPETQGKIEALLLSGHPRLTLAPGYLKTPTLNLTFEGEVSADTGSPAGHFKVSADGLDKAIALLRDVVKTGPETQTALLGLTFLKGLAKTGEDGRLLWEIDVTGDGEVSVNGMSLPTGK